MSLELNPKVCPLSFSNSAGMIAQCAGDKCGFYEAVAGDCAILVIARSFSLASEGPP